MTTKVKAKPLSQIRQEKKLAKMQRKAKVISKLAKEKQAKTELQKNANEVALKFENSLKNVKSVRKDSELTLEEYFPKAINELDHTLTDIVSSIQTMGSLRTQLSWEQVKGNFIKEDVEKFEISLLDLENSNEVFEKRIVEVVNESVKGLEKLKKEPTRPLLDAYVLDSSTKAFAVFAEWNETMIDKFHTTNDLLDSLKTGEEK